MQAQIYICHEAVKTNQLDACCILVMTDNVACAIKITMNMPEII